MSIYIYMSLFVKLTLYRNCCFVEPGPIAKSSVVLEVKPWDDETDMKEMERLVRSIEMDGLVWGACKFTVVDGNLLLPYFLRSRFS